MRLYNTLTRAVDEVYPISPPKVTVYTCGPTVYDYAHVGHWFNYVRMDMLIRTLKASGLHPVWVMNITDVGHLVSDADEGEDKLEKGARREGKTAWEVAQFYTDDFLRGMKALNITEPDYLVKATDHIPEQIALIKALEDKGYTYSTNDGIYYDTSLFEGYDSFARLDLDQLQAGARVSINPQKRHPSDFALWKFSPKDHVRDMEWDSPWGKGFPGWHIECSAMSMKYLGPSLDIHTGGIDHVPVHHTNEIAQSEAATGKRFAHYWLHSNHVLIDNEKISKSLGNGIRLDDVISRGITAEALRLHILESHYRSQSKFSWESLDAAVNRLQDFYAVAALRFQAQANIRPVKGLDDVPKRLIDILCQDIDTPGVLAYLASIFNVLLGQGIALSQVETLRAALQAIDDYLGLRLLEVTDLAPTKKDMLMKRAEARINKDWTTSDSLREQLAGEGIGLNDLPDGTSVWFPLIPRAQTQAH